jgi:hypothetical protein
LDETYQIYLNRVARMTLPEMYRTQAQYIQESPKFKLQPTGERTAIPFPGYTLISPPWSALGTNTPTVTLYKTLETCQQKLQAQLPSGFLVPVPPASFHLTLADLIWDSAYRDALKANPDFDTTLPQAIAQIFSHHDSLTEQRPIRLQALGIAIMPRALAVCLSPVDETAYARMTQFRRAVYQSPDLIALGIEQQYGFTAHVTLGYFGQIPPDQGQGLAQLTDILSDLNQVWLDTPQILEVEQAELRRFDDMTNYHRETSWPILKF